MEEEEEATNQTKKKDTERNNARLSKIEWIQIQKKSKSNEKQQKKIKLKRGGHGSDFCF